MKNNINCNNKINIIFCIAICIQPILFFTEDKLINYQELIDSLSYITDTFSGIENISMLAKDYGLYYYAKLQIIFVVIGIVILLPFQLYRMIKLYLNCLGYIKKDKDIFILEIKEKGTLLSLKKYFLLSLLFIFMAEYFIFNNIIQFNENFFLIYLYSNKIGLFLLSFILVNSLPCAIAFIFVEGIAQVMKFVRIKKMVK